MTHTRPAGSTRTARTPANPSQIATQLAAQPSLWRELIRFDPVSRFYARLAAERGFEAWLLTWVPGQGTEWHDHGGSAGAFVVLQGSLTEEHAAVRPLGSPRIVPGARELTAGALRSFGTKHLHKVTNNGLEGAVSLHVYSPALVEMNAYEPAVDDPSALLHLGTQSAGISW